MQIYKPRWPNGHRFFEHLLYGNNILYDNFLMRSGSDTLSPIRKFLRNFLMRYLFSATSGAGNLDFTISRVPIRKFPRNFLMRTWVSDPEPIRKFLRNFLLRSRKKFKLFWGAASQPAS